MQERKHYKDDFFLKHGSVIVFNLMNAIYTHLMLVNLENKKVISIIYYISTIGIISFK